MVNIHNTSRLKLLLICFVLGVPGFLEGAALTSGSVSLVSSLNPATLGQAVTLTATVTPSTATGKVTFYDGVVPLGTSPLTGGHATLTTKLLPSGTNAVKAVYQGDNTHTASQSSALLQAVHSLPESSFLPAASFTAGTNPRGVAAADFNGDGKIDLAIADYSDASHNNNVIVLLGNGDGTFQTPKYFGAGLYPHALAAVDLDGDGKADLVVANLLDNNVSVLLGNGDGTFRAAVNYSTGNGPTAMVAGDFDGDGKIDIAVTNENDNNLSVLLGNGDGTFGTAANYSTGQYPLALTAGDFNGDGVTDLATANYFDNTVTVLAGKGNGTFQSGLTFAVGTSPRGIAAADFNGDGDTDLAVANEVSTTVSVLPGKGDGTFGAAQSYAVNQSSLTAIATADFNGDGITDLVAVDYFGVDVLPGAANGSFPTAAHFSAGIDGRGVVVVDLNGDGLTDLVTVSAESTQNVSVLLGKAGTATVTTLTAAPSPASFHQSVTITATLSSTAATGSMVFKDGGVVLGSATVSGGAAVFAATGFSLGTHALTAAYSGDSNFAASTGAVSLAVNPAPVVVTLGNLVATFDGTPKSVTATTNPAGVSLSFSYNGNSLAPIATGSYSVVATVTDPNYTGSATGTLVIKAGPSVTLTSSLNPSPAGQSLTLTATVTPAGATGKVTFYDGVNPLATESLANSHAVMTTSVLASGTHLIKALYSGDATYGAKTSAVLAQTITPAAQGGFVPSTDNSSGGSATSMAVGDFNGDGKSDVVFACTTSSAAVDANSGQSLPPGSYAVIVRLGAGTGVFPSGLYYTLGTAPASVSIGDFNGDGRSDLVVADQAGISILLGNGDGTFKAAVAYTAGDTPNAIAIADFNGDGKADIAVANAGLSSSGTLSILLGNGDGTFQTAVTYSSGTSSLSIAAGDFNGDGKADLAISNPIDNNISVFLGQGDGTFAAAVKYSAGVTPESLAAGDLNGDGKADLVVANYSANTVSLLPGNGDGTFAAPVSFATGQSPSSVALVDFNADGKLDIVVANNSDNNVGVLAGKGDGTFLPQVTYLSGANPGFVASGDFNGDGRLDLISLNNNSAAKTFSVFLGGAFVASGITLKTSINPSNFGQAVTLTATVSPAAATGRVTFYEGVRVLGTTPLTGGQAVLKTVLSAGVLAIRASYSGDLVYAPSTSPALSQTVLAQPQSGFGPAVGLAAGPLSRFVAAGDLNGDGEIDLVVANGGNADDQDYGSISIFYGNGDGTFQSPVSIEFSADTFPEAFYPRAVTIGDFDGDGKADLAVALDEVITSIELQARLQPSTASPVSQTSPGTVLLFGNGDGTFRTVFTPLSGDQAIAVADFDRDTLPDLVVVQATNAVDLLFGVASGTLRPSTNLPTGEAPLSVTTGDFNGDGIPDVATANSADGTISVFLGNGNRTFQPAVTWSVGTTPAAIAAGDFDGDGKLDLAVANQGSNTVSILTGKGDGTFKPAVNYAAPGGPTYLVLADVNGDGKTDLVLSNQTTANLSVLAGNGDGTFQTAVNYSAGSAPGSLTVRDFNGDGLADIAVTSSADGKVYILFGLPAQTISFAAIGNVTFGVAAFNVTATASSGLVVSLTSTTPLICTVSGTSVSIVAAGICSLTASQTGNQSFGAAQPVVRTFAVIPGAQTITFAALPNVPRSAPPFTLTASASSGLPVTYVGNTPAACTVADGTVTILALGPCSITASQPGNTNYMAAVAVTQSFTVGGAEQTISFAALPNIALGSTPFTVTATATSGLPVTLTVSTPSVCTLVGTTLSAATIGTCSITASQSGNSSYAAAVSVTQSFSISQGSQTITFGALTDQVFPGAPSVVSATASSGLAVQFSTTTPLVCAVTGNSVSIGSAGTCSIVASQPGNANFPAAKPVTQTFNIAKAAQSIDFDSLSSAHVGDPPVPLIATATSSLTVTFASTTPAVCVVNMVNLSIVSVGTCSVVASQSGNGNYTAALPVTQSFTVSQGSQTITFSALPTITLGAAGITLSATASSHLPVSFASTTPSVCTVTGNPTSTLTAVATGLCSVTASQSGGTNYAAAPTVTQSVTVKGKPQTITFGALPSITLPASSFGLTATASSGLTVTFSSNSPATCTVTGTILTPVAAGTCVVVASQPGDANFAAASPVTQIFTISPGYVPDPSLYYFLAKDPYLDANGQWLTYPNLGPFDPTPVSLTLPAVQPPPTYLALQAVLPGGRAAGIAGCFDQNQVDAIVTQNVPWIHITLLMQDYDCWSDLEITLDNNTGATRTGTISIAPGLLVGDYNYDTPGDQGVATFTQLGTPCGGFSISLPGSPGANPAVFSGDVSTSTIQFTTAPSDAGCLAQLSSSGDSPVVTSDGWITVTDFSSTAGEGHIQLDANLTSATRTGTLSFGNTAQRASLSIQQPPAGCSYTLTPSPATFAGGAGTGTYTLVSSSLCDQTPTAINTDSPAWLHPGAPDASGAGTFSVDANSTGADRTGNLSYSGQTAQITQSADVCLLSITLAGNQQRFSGDFPIQLGFNTTPTSSSGCADMPSGPPTADSWIQVFGFDPESGTGQIEFGANDTGATRVGIIAWGSTGARVIQFPKGCSYFFGANPQSFGKEGGSGTYNLSATSSCDIPPTQVYTGQGTWIHPSVLAAGGGTFTVDANTTGVDRVGTIAFGNNSATITQGSSCAVSITLPGTKPWTFPGGQTTIAFQTTPTDPACSSPPTAVTATGGITLANDWTYESGFGHAVITPNNTGATLVDTLTFGTATATLQQVPANCTYQLTGSQGPFSSAGGTGTFTVIASPSCDLTPGHISASVPWLHPAAIGSGGAASFSVDLNQTGSIRTGALGYFDQVLTITQDAPQLLLTTSVDPAGSGFITPGGMFDAETPVSITASPASGYKFTGFSGDLTDTVSPAVVTMNRPRTVVANFTAVATTTPPASSGGGGGGGSAPGGGSALTISPSSVSISAALGGSPGSASVTLSYQTQTQGAPGFSSNFSTNQGQGWISVSPASGTMTQVSYAGFLYTYTATVNINADPTGIPAGSAYTGTVNFSAGSGIISVPVTLNVSAVPAKLTVAPQAMAFSYQQGSTAFPAAQNLSVFSLPAGGSFTASVSGAGNWLTVGAGSTTPGAVPVSVNVSGLAPGTYTAGIAIASAPSVNIAVPVTLTVTPASPPLLSVSPAVGTFSIAQGGSPASGQVTVSNTGGGTLRFTASSDQSWLTVAASGTAVAGSPVSLAFGADPSNLPPGVYIGHLAFRDQDSSAQSVVTVVLTVTTPAKPSIGLSKTGISLIGVAGGASPPVQTVQVSNTGAGTLNWTVQTSTTSGGGWLLAASSGSTISVSANTAGLPAGQYYGSVNVVATNAVNSPQMVSVALNVVAPAAAPGVSISTGGILLTGVAGGAPASQDITLYNASSATVAYSAGIVPAAAWLSATPAGGALSAGANTIHVTADMSGLAAGVQVGTVTFGFADGTAASLEVVTLVLPQGGSARGGLLPQASVAACPGGKPSYLIPVFSLPANLATLQVASATTLQVLVVDDCGHALKASGGWSVQIVFSDGDAGVRLNDVGGGLWEATWVPSKPASALSLSVQVSAGGLAVNPSLGALSSLTVNVLPAPADAAPQPTGIANAASAAQATPGVVAPGSYIAIYGTGLAGSGNPSATSLPLPNSLNGTQLFLGGLPMPLLYAGPGQVNALVPQGIAPNASYPLLVVRGNAQSVPVSLTVTELEPGVYTADTSGSGAGIVTNALTGALISNSNPAHSGDYLVIYCTGLGQLIGAGGETQPADGAAASPAVLYRTTATVTATIGGVTAPVLFSGLTPTFAGLYQVNVQVPAGVAAGSAVPVVLTAADSATGAIGLSNSVAIAMN